MAVLRVHQGRQTSERANEERLISSWKLNSRAVTENDGPPALPRAKPATVWSPRVPNQHRGEPICVSGVQGPDLRHLAWPRRRAGRLVLGQRDVGEIDTRHQLNSAPRGNVSPSSRFLITHRRIEWMQ